MARKIKSGIMPFWYLKVLFVHLMLGAEAGIVRLKIQEKKERIVSGRAGVGGLQDRDVGISRPRETK